jgi:hypothetical protein
LCWGVLKGSGAMREVSRDMVGRDFSIKRRFVAHRTVASVASCDWKGKKDVSFHFCAFGPFNRLELTKLVRAYIIPHIY